VLFCCLTSGSSCHRAAVSSLSQALHNTRGRVCNKGLRGALATICTLKRQPVRCICLCAMAKGQLFLCAPKQLEQRPALTYVTDDRLEV
jgi:hypothetical protein